MRTWRTIEIYKDKSLAGTSGKETFALPRTHMIGDLWLSLRITNAADGNNDPNDEWDSIERHLDSIKIKSGSKTFKEYDGEMCRLMAAHRDGQLAPEIRSQVLSVEQEQVFPIHFGLEPQDEDVILPAPLLDSLDMVLEYSFPTTAGEGFTDSGEFDLYANVLEPTADLEDKMILVQEKKQDLTYVVTGGATPYDLTLDERRLLRKVYVQAYVTAVAEGAVCSDLKLKADNEEVIAGKWRYIQLQNAIDSRLNFHQDITLEASSGADEIYQSRMPDAKVTSFTDFETGGTNFFKSLAGDAVTYTMSTDADSPLLSLRSDVLPTVAILDFDRDNSLRRLQPQGIRDLDLVLTHLAAGAGAIYEESLQKIW